MKYNLNFVKYIIDNTPGLDINKRINPTQKPIKLIEWFLTKFSKKNNIIVDLFGGSGSTLIACEQLDRKCRMMEIDEQYCQVIVDRFVKFKKDRKETFKITKNGKDITTKFET